MSSFHLVIRSAGERTQSVSADLARLQVRADENISVLSEVPFESALRATYEAGIRAGKEWTITLDADVLLSNDGISQLLKHARQMPSHYFELEGRVYDKITGSYRQAGHRVYRTELLPRALEQIPEPGSRIQPEYFTVLQMGSLGHPFRHVGCVVGLHDFEQNYFDLYRKAMVHSRKMSSRIAVLVERCAERMHDDADFLVILKGLWDGLMTKEALTIDRRIFVARGAEALHALGIEEKSRIEDEDRFIEGFSAIFDGIVSRYPASDIPIVDDPKLPDPAEPGWVGKVQQRIAKYGLLRGGTASLGALLKLIGGRLDR